MYNNTSDKDLHTWHLRLGHLSDTVMHQLPFLSNSRSSEHKCYVCPMAKQTRNSFPKSIIQSEQPFELVHIDIWGHYHTYSLFGENYILTLVDDFTRATWTYLMSYKSQTCATLAKYIKLMQNNLTPPLKLSGVTMVHNF